MRTNKITKESLNEFIIKARWTRADNYSGPDMSDWLTGPSRSRDSDLLAESNFETALEMLGGEVEGVVEVHRFGHWGCGWFETIMVNSKKRRAAKKLLEIKLALDDYPLLDNSDYSEREFEAQIETFEQNSGQMTDAAVEALKVATDIPEELLELLKDANAFKMLVNEAYFEACSHSGYEDGWITDRNFVKHYSSIYLGHFADSDLNTLSLELNNALGVSND